MAKFKSTLKDIQRNLTVVMGNKLKPSEGTTWVNEDGETLTIIGHQNGNYKAEVQWSNGETEYIQWDKWDRLEKFAIA